MLRLHAPRQGFTRVSETGTGEVNEEAIESLTAIFYHDNNGSLTVDKIVAAEKVEESEENDFTVKYEGRAGNFPDYLGVIANYDGEIGESHLSHKISGLHHDRLMVMSGTRYFDMNKRDTYYSLLSTENFMDSKPVDVFLERAAAKITLSKESNFEYKTPEIYHNGKKISLQLTICGWNVNATDRETYLFKHLVSEGNYNLLYTALEQELTDATEEDNWKWNEYEYDAKNSKYPTLHWNHSENYLIKDFPLAGKTKDDDDIIELLTYEEVDNEIGDAEEKGTIVYVHETTRPAEAGLLPNGMPEIVITGYYTLEGETPVTFYREGNEILTEAEYKIIIAGLQDSFYDGEGLKISEEMFWELTEDAVPQSDVNYGFNQVCRQLRESGLLSEEQEIYDKNGERIDFKNSLLIEKLNNELLVSLRVREKYEDGCCFFSFPVRHERRGEGTGKYGIVRNHYYNIMLKSIEGIGSGIADKSLTLGRIEGVATEAPDYEINVTFLTMPWIAEEGGDVELSETVDQ